MPTEMPRFVPTLTEVVGGSVPATPPDAAVPDGRHPDDIAEQIAHRVLQRVDAALETRLTATIRAVVERHTAALLPTLREEIVAAVQDTVARALADEFHSPSPETRA